MYIDCSDVSRIILSPHHLQKHRTAVDLSCMRGQKLKELKFLAGKIDFLIREGDTAVVEIHAEITDLYNVLFYFLCLTCTRSTADYGLDPALDFQRIKRLCHIIIRPVVKPQDFIHIISAGSEHDDRHVRKLPYLLQYFKTRQLWEHNVQQHDIILPFPDHPQSLFSVISTLYLVPVLLKTETQSFHDHLLIIHDQYFHCHKAYLLHSLKLFPYNSDGAP